MAQPTPPIITNVSENKPTDGSIDPSNSSEWCRQIPIPTVGFYAKPLIRKWLKTFPSPSLLVIADIEEPKEAWQALFNSKSVETLRWSDAHHVPHELTQVELLIILHPALVPTALIPMLAYLKKGGAVICVTPNLFSNWPHWQTELETVDLVDTFPVGFHPQRAIAWWPFQTQPLVGLGQFVEFLWTFFPGRYELGLRLGRLWMLRGFKRDDVTQVTG